VNARDVPTTLCIRGRTWRIVWRDHDEDHEWRKKKAWGMCYHDDREIHLDSSLQHIPDKLASTFIHEVMHAACPASGSLRRKMRLSERAEEQFIKAVAPFLALVLNQIGWTRTVP